MPRLEPRPARVGLLTPEGSPALPRGLHACPSSRLCLGLRTDSHNRGRTGSGNAAPAARDPGGVRATTSPRSLLAPSHPARRANGKRATSRTPSHRPITGGEGRAPLTSLVPGAWRPFLRAGPLSLLPPRGSSVGRPRKPGAGPGGGRVERVRPGWLRTQERGAGPGSESPRRSPAPSSDVRTLLVPPIPGWCRRPARPAPARPGPARPGPRCVCACAPAAARSTGAEEAPPARRRHGRVPTSAPPRTRRATTGKSLHFPGLVSSPVRCGG
ncbi:uncharacterized protein LOC141521398 [Macrotis lagotis]|uniref:uncharacterized protein LOC141521398 n=1 Tax=Macrotis lagotis TaxID=92651 RepID=UPI003D696AC3